MRSWILVALISLLSASAFAQHTTVTAQVFDPTGVTYRNCTGSANFVGQNTTPGAGPYLLGGSVFQTVVPISCDSFGKFTISLADNNQISPTPSQWNFSICSALNAFPGPPICFNTLITITGTNQNVTTTLQAASVTLPPYAVKLETNGVVNGTQGLLNLIQGTNITITDNGLGGVTISSSGGGGGGGLPPFGTGTSVTTTNLVSSTPGDCAVWAVGNVLGDSPCPGGTGIIGSPSVSTQVVGNGFNFVSQARPSYDVRDWATCDGTSDSTSVGPHGGVKALLNTIGSTEATILWIGSTVAGAHCRLENTVFPANISHDFSGGGAIEMISSTTPVGGAVFVNGTSAECNGGGSGLLCNTANATSGSTTLTLTAGNAAIVSVQPYPGFTFKITSVTDNCNDIFYHVQQSLANQPRNVGVWVASNLTGGTCTITANANGATTHIQVLVNQFSGMGPVVSPDGKGACTNADSTTMTATASSTAGSLLFAYGGQPFTAETCSAGAGFTQPAGLAGQSTNGFACAQYQLSSAGGSVTANQTITSSPTGSWVYCQQPLKVGNATATILGGITDPDLHQIFFNSQGTATTGAIDFTGASVLQDVRPEWWGASNTASPTVNTAALQASIWAAFGNGPSATRNNGSGLNVYNRPWHLSSNYSINGELQLFDVINFKIVCDGRLNSGITQTASNARIFNAQSIAYGAFYDCGWTSSASSTLPQIDLDYDGVTTPGDLRPQFIDFKHNGFFGGGLAAVGVQIAKSGGGAQGSNIYCDDCAAQSFTTAAWQIGTPTVNAQNALAIGWSGGDIQGSPQYGIANYGGGFITIYGTTFENGFSSQTGYDVLSSAPQGPMIMEHVRSESRKIVSAANLYLIDSGNANQAAHWAPGSSAPVGTIYTGNQVTGDGAYYQVTTDSGGFIGAGTVGAPIIASSGTSTSITDTNQTVAGSQTIGTFILSETVTQATTGSTATLLNLPVSTATVTGTNGSTPITPGETFTQTSTGITATQVTPTPGVSSSQSLFLVHLSGTADNSHTWVGGSSGAVYTPSAAPTFSATAMFITASTGAPDNSHNWTGGTSAAVFVPTTSPVNTAGWTVNAFTGYLVGFLSGTSANCYGIVTSNTATSISFSGGLVTQYPLTLCPAPDSTTGLMVEPNWNHGTISSGGMVLQYMNETVIDGANGVTGVSSGRIQDVGVSGGQVALWPNPRGSVTVSNLQTSRPDWWCCSAGGTPQISGQNYHKWDVHVLLPGANTAISWAYPKTGSATQFSGAIQEDLGSRVLTWMTGTVGGGSNVSARPVWIGGRSDQGSSNDATRTILEYGGMLGRAVLTGTDQAGTDTDITGGPSTGAGNGGAINFWTSNPSGSGTTPNSGLKRWLVSTGGHFFAGLDNTYDIGATGANRPRSLYLSNSVNVQDAGTFGSMQTQTSAACETSFGATTLNVGGTTTDTSLSCLPANSIIDALVYRIITTITTAANFIIGDATTAARFCNTQSTLTAGTTGVCFVQADQTGAPGPRQVSAAKVRVTTNANPGAGIIRMIVYYHTWTAPAS
jgi:hypothetical protein